MEQLLKLLLKDLTSCFNVRIELKDDDREIGRKIGKREIIEYLERKLEETQNNVFEDTQG